MDLCEKKFVKTHSFKYQDGIEYSSDLYKCQKCNMLQFDNKLSEAEMATYYTDVYVKMTASWYTLANSYIPNVYAKQADWLIEHFHRFRTDLATIHDIGCGYGGMVHQFRNIGYDAYGSEYNANVVAEATAHGNHHIFNCSLSEIYPAIRSTPPDLFIMNHVLEHVPDPVTLLAEIKAYMGSETLLICRVPNGEYLPFLVGMEKQHPWFNYPSHLHYFTAKSIQCLADKAGLAVLDVHCTTREPLEKLMDKAKSKMGMTKIGVDELAKRNLTGELVFIFGNI